MADPASTDTRACTRSDKQTTKQTNKQTNKTDPWTVTPDDISPPMLKDGDYIDSLTFIAVTPDACVLLTQLLGRWKMGLLNRRFFFVPFFVFVCFFVSLCYYSKLNAAHTLLCCVLIDIF
jgi:hypothetical protein